MKVSRKLWIVGLVLFCFVVATTTAVAETVIKASTSTNPSHIYNQALYYMADIVKEKSNGEMEIKVFPSAQLGSERDAVEGLQLGTLEMTLTSTGPLGNFVPEVKLFNLPFLFKDRKEAYKILDGEIGQEIADLFVKVGIRSLGWYENGFRNVTNNVRSVKKPEDMKGLKIRVMEDSLFISTMKALGASPLPMAFGELYTALEQGTVDAQENPLAVIDSSRFQEVQKYLSMTGHFYSPAMLLVSEAFYQGLNAEQKEILKEAAKLAKDYERQLSIKADQTLEEKLSKGMEIAHPDKEPFMKAVEGLYKDPDVLKQIGRGDVEKGRALVEKTLKALGR